MPSWSILLAHFVVLSLISIGGGLTIAPDIQRLLVDEMALLDSAQFNASIAIAQASPGPNILFVAVLGYQAAGWAGATASLVGMTFPSTMLCLVASRWGEARQGWLPIRAFKAGMAPITIGLLFSTAWILASNMPGWRTALLVTVSGLLVWRTRLHLLWIIGAGALLGAAGLV
jgi:chromate transporter